MCFFKKYHESLFKCFKPYQYVGGEFLSRNKDFDSAKVRVALAFPDKYEIGISNLGVRVLYELVNKEQNYMCDRVYAPEPDFKPMSLYALESKKALRDFDVIGFSLQYEMSYPTVLKMLEMAQIPYKNSDRTDDDPIIIAGGPCAYNPLPLSDFIDVFMIGYGEDTIIETCKILEETKGMSRIERIKKLCEGENSGRWSKLVGWGVKKRIAQLTYDTALKSYPIPFSSSVQDRAVVEIRRGCGRMCRFCQPGHVTLPVSERSAEDIIKIAKELVKNTGYDEYSLLSLSSNDYENINEVIKELSVDFNEKNISVSLPSQRIDGFNLELANLVQSVRKSTMTLAPEAGSQRLRDVNKKNITDEQIMDAVLTLYQNGWSRVKFYFMCGLPTETIQDMDEMAELLKKIRYTSKLIKAEKNLKHSLDLTCTLSIFVPKPFTPFQWCAQMNLDEVSEHIKYLKSKTDHIKGVKINYHERYVSQIEAVMTRGDDSLCKYIEALYKKGCYLDAWNEYFDKKVWQDTAIESGIDLALLAEKQYCTEEPLPWDFVDIGVNKEWFIDEYKKAFCQNKEFVIQPTCEHRCVNCGVCSNLKVKKILAEPFEISDKAKNIKPVIRNPKLDTSFENEIIYKYRIKITKLGNLKYFSHLDWQNTFVKALARTGLNVAYSHGFNPLMKVSMGVALPLFIESRTEFIDIDLLEEIPEDLLAEKLTLVLPELARVTNVKKLERPYKSIDTTVYWAEYDVKSVDDNLYKIEELKYNLDKIFSSEEILISKKNKKGLNKTINIKPSIYSYKLENGSLFIILRTGQKDELPTVRIDDFIKLVDKSYNFNIVRTRFFDKELNEL